MTDESLPLKEADAVEITYRGDEFIGAATTEYGRHQVERFGLDLFRLHRVARVAGIAPLGRHGLVCAALWFSTAIRSLLNRRRLSFASSTISGNSPTMPITGVG